MPHPYLDVAGPHVFAHRGLVTPELAAMGVAENSLAAFDAAVAAGADYVETDCHLTSDGRVVLFHDSNLERVTGDRRELSSVTHAELEALMSGRGGLGTLEEVLLAHPRTRFNIDVKAEAAAAAVGRIVSSHGTRTLVTSFSDAVRRRALRAAAAAQDPRGVLPATSPGRAGLARLLLALTVRSRAATARALDGVDALQIPERHGAIRVLSPRLVEAAHRAGVEVHVWTINEPRRMRELVALGVDGIITDRADLGLAALRA